MTLCNMSIEAGARAGMIAPDETTFSYLKGRRVRASPEEWDERVAYWRTLPTRRGRAFDSTVEMDAPRSRLTSRGGRVPGMVVPVTGRVPDPGRVSE